MAAVLDHPSFKQPEDADADLWRYMDLSKFVAFLQKRALFFVRSDCLGEKFEGSYPVPNIKQTENSIANMLASPELDHLKEFRSKFFDEAIIQNAWYNKSALRSVYINCWHMNDCESAGMWKIYSKSNDSVAIKTSYSLLSRALPINVYLGQVTYIDYKNHLIESKTLLDPFMFKRRSFSHEREVRAVLWDMPEGEGQASSEVKAVSVEINQLVKSVYINPEAPVWFREIVAQLSEIYGLGAAVNQSDINAEPLY